MEIDGAWAHANSVKQAAMNDKKRFFMTLLF